MKALLLIDIQNDFVRDGALAIPGGESIIPKVNEIQKNFDLIIATQDWHPSSHGSFADNHPNRSPGEVIDLHGLKQVLWPVHCVQGSFGAQFAPDLDMDRVEKVFVKGTEQDIDSYSGLYDNGHRKSTGLSEYLKEKGVTDVYIVGLAADFCVKFTALDAIRDGFNTHLYTNATKGVNFYPDDTQKAFMEVEAAGVKLIQG